MSPEGEDRVGPPWARRSTKRPALTLWRALPFVLVSTLVGCQTSSPAVAPIPPGSAAPAVAPPSAPGSPSPSVAPSRSAAASADAGNLPVLQVAYTALTENHLALWIGTNNNLFQQYGTQVQATFIASTPTAFAALLSGDATVLAANSGDLVRAVSKGADVRVIAVVETTTPYKLWVKPGIQAPGDLVGKSVGVSKLGSASYLFAKKMLQAWGIDGQVTIVATGDLSSTRAAYRADAIQGYADTVVNVSALDPTTIQQLGDPGELVHFLEGYVAASAVAYNDENAAEQVLANHLQSQDPQFLQTTYQEFVRSPMADGGMPLDPTPTTAMMQQQIDLQALVDSSFDPGSFNTASLIDASLMDSVKASSMWTQLWPHGLPNA